MIDLLVVRSLGIATPKSSDGNRRINLDYTLAAAKGFQKALAPRLADQGKKFRFVYCSGMMTERDQERKLWFMGEMRRTRVCILSISLPLPDLFLEFLPFVGVRNSHGRF